MNINIPESVKKALEILNSKGFSAYAVGGCVRDNIMGKVPHDWDITTDAAPQNIKNAFLGFKTFDTGIKYGTVSVVIDGETLEITTFRDEKNYSDHRTPHEVNFVRSLEDDLKRRDFTINALCTSGGEIIDMFGGIKDINNKTIRAIGDPDERFCEDALRILRALRFSSVLGFEIEEATKESIFKNRWLLRYVSRERIRVELLKLLAGENAKNILLEYREIIAVVVPDVRRMFNVPQNTPHHKYDVYTHTVESVTNIYPDPILRLTMLLHDIGKPSVLKIDRYGVAHFKMHPEQSVKIADKVLRSLKMSNEDTKYILSLIKEHDNRVEESERKMKRLLKAYDYSERFFEDYMKVRFADTLAQSEYLKKEKLNKLHVLYKNANEFIKSNKAVKIKDLLINGNDLLELGFVGIEIGDILNEMAENIVLGDLNNTREELIRFAKSKR